MAADEAQAAEDAVAARPEVAAARERLNQAERQLDATRAGYRPRLTANYSVGGRYANYVTSDAVSGQGSTSVILSIPFFDPVISANVRDAEAKVAAARAAFLQASLTVKSGAVQASIALHTARATLAQAERVGSAAATTLIQAEGRYASGATPLMELLDAQAADATARLGVIRARLSVELATVQLLSATGHLGDLTHRP
jgi:outer membrane protein TolC